MSSSGRGGKRSPADNYPTPAWCTRRALKAIRLPGGTWLDPCAGTGTLIQAASELRDDVEWHADEIRRECASRLKGLVPVSKIAIADFLTESLQNHRRYSVVLTNPPNSLAEDFLCRALEIGNHVVLLLRFNFLASGRRAALMRTNTPDVYVLPNRPSFNGIGPDSIDDAWFHWDSRKKGRGSLSVLPYTQLQERRKGIIRQSATF